MIQVCKPFIGLKLSLNSHFLAQNRWRTSDFASLVRHRFILFIAPTLYLSLQFIKLQFLKYCVSAYRAVYIMSTDDINHPYRRLALLPTDKCPICSALLAIVGNGVNKFVACSMYHETKCKSGVQIARKECPCQACRMPIKTVY